MADERVSSFATPEFFTELTRAKNELKDIVGGIVDANNAAKRAEGFAMQAKTIKDVATASGQLSDQQEKLVKLSKVLGDGYKDTIAIMSVMNGSSMEFVKVHQEVIRMKQLEEKTTKATTQAVKEDVSVRQTAAAEKKRIQSEERELNRLIAAEERAQNAKSREEKRQANKEKLEAERAYQRTWEQLLKERDNAERASAAARKAEAAQAVSTVANDSIVAMSRTLDQHRLSFNRLTQAERENINIGGVLQARIQELDKTIKSSDAALGVYRRNVGNYSSAFDGLGFAIRNIAGELPNIGISLRTFGQSVSNNIQPLIFALQQLRLQNAQLAAEGKPTVSAGKAIAASLFSWETAALAAVAGITYLITNMKKTESATEKAEKTTKKYVESLNSIEEGARSSAQAEIAHANVLTRIAADNTQSMANRLKAVKELQETYPARFGNLDKEIILEGKVAEALRVTTQELLNKASAQAAEKKFAAAGETVYDLEIALKAAGKEVDKFQAAVDRNKNNPIGFTKVDFQRQLKNAQEAYRGISAELTKARTEQLNYLDDAQKFAQQAGDTILNNSKPGKAKKPKAPTDFTNSEIKAEEDLTKALYDQLKQRSEASAVAHKAIADDETNNLQKRADAYEYFTFERLNAIGLESAKEQQIIRDKLDKIAEIESKPNAKRTNSEKRLLLSKAALEAQLVTVTEKFEAERTGVIEDNVKFQTNLIKAYGKEAEDAIKQAQKNLQGINIGGPSQSRKEFDAEREARFQLYNEGISQAQGLSDFTSALADRRIGEINAEIEAINKKRDAEIAGIEKSGASATEKEQRIAEAKARAAAQETALDNERRKRARRAAIFEKGVTIAQIIATTSLAVMKAYAEGDTYSKVARAILAGSAGAFQLANAIATKIPEYREGTKGIPHPGGPAKMGEGNKAEAVFEPGKAPRIVSKEGIYDLAAGSHVLSNPDLMKITQMYTLGVPAMLPVTNSPAFDTSELKKGLDDVRKAIENKPVMQAHVSNLGAQWLMSQGNSVTKYIKNFGS